MHSNAPDVAGTVFFPGYTEADADVLDTVDHCQTGTASSPPRPLMPRDDAADMQRAVGLLTVDG